MTKLFTMLVGIPYSGKSTYIKKLKESGECADDVIISTDKFIEAYGREQNLPYSIVFEEYIGEATDMMWKEIHESIKQGKNIIWDQTNLTVKSRKQKLDKIDVSDYRKAAIYFELPSDEVIAERMTKRFDKVVHWGHVNRMKSQYQVPTKDEGFDIIIKCDTDGNLSVE